MHFLDFFSQALLSYNGQITLYKFKQHVSCIHLYIEDDYHSTS